MGTGDGNGAEMKIVDPQTDCKSVGGRVVTSLFNAIKQTSAECEGVKVLASLFLTLLSPSALGMNYIIPTSPVEIESGSLSTRLPIFTRIDLSNSCPL